MVIFELMRSLFVMPSNLMSGSEANLVHSLQWKVRFAVLIYDIYFKSENMNKQRVCILEKVSLWLACWVHIQVSFFTLISRGLLIFRSIFLIIKFNVYETCLNDIYEVGNWNTSIILRFSFISGNSSTL